MEGQQVGPARRGGYALLQTGTTLCSALALAAFLDRIPTLTKWAKRGAFLAVPVSASGFASFYSNVGETRDKMDREALDTTRAVGLVKLATSVVVGTSILAGLGKLSPNRLAPFFVAAEGFFAPILVGSVWTYAVGGSLGARQRSGFDSL